MNALAVFALSLLVALPCAAQMAEAREEAQSRSAVDVEALEDFYADLVLDSLDGRTWLLTAGPLDAALKRRAALRRVPLVLLPVDPVDDDATKAWKDSVEQGPGKDSPRLVTATLFGPVVFARQWLKTNPGEAAAALATMVFPDILYEGSLRASPQGLVFAASRGMGDADALSAKAERYRALFGVVARRLNENARTTAALATARQYMRRQSAHTANDFGVALLRAGRNEDAHDFFALARKLDPKNISALLNQMQCVRLGVHPEGKAALGKAIEEWRENDFNVEQLWGLTQVFGQVDAVGDLLATSWFWTLSGIPGAETDRWKAVLAKVPEANRPGVEKLLQRTHVLQRGGTDAAMEIVDDLFTPDRRANACLLLCRVYRDRGEFGNAEKWLAEARKAGGAADLVLLEEIRLARAQGDIEESLADARKAVAAHPDSVPLLLLHAEYATEARDAETLEGIVERLQELKAPPGDILGHRAQLCLFQGRPAEARNLYLQEIEADPNALQAYNKVLALDLALGEQEAAEAHARAILRKSFGHVLANYVMGSLLLARKDYESAETHFTRSLHGDRRFVPALNDYAMLFVETGRAAKAEALIREAMRNGTGLDDAELWDSLALACEAQENFDEAHEALAKSVKCLGAKANPHILIHWLRSLKRQGDAEGAAKVVEQLQGIYDTLSPEQKNVFDTLK